MEIKADISVEDLEVIQENMDYFLKVFPRFRIVADYFKLEDETFVEYSEGVDMFSFKEVVFEMDNMNNFWALAKFVQQFKMEKL